VRTPRISCKPSEPQVEVEGFTELGAEACHFVGLARHELLQIADSVQPKVLDPEAGQPHLSVRPEVILPVGEVARAMVLAGEVLDARETQRLDLRAQRRRVVGGAPRFAQIGGTVMSPGLSAMLLTRRREKLMPSM